MERFLENPGDEDSSFEVKRKEKVNTAQGRHDVVRALAAMSNSEGGTLLIGLGTEGTQLLIDSFPPESETLRDLWSVAHDRTKPSLETYLTGRWDRYARKRLLRIDVDPIHNGVISFKENNGDWGAFVRVQSTTRRMTPDEILQRAAKAALRDVSPLLVANGAMKGAAAVVRKLMPPAPPLRMITETADHVHPVFGEISGIRTYDRPALHHLAARVDLRTPDKWPGFFAHLRQELHLKLDDLAYSVKVGRRVLCGIGIAAMLADVRNIRAVGEGLLNGVPRPPRVSDQRFLPLLSAYVPFGDGFFWIQAEFQGHSDFWFREECGFTLSDILFDDADVRQFFRAVNATPPSYESEIHTQGLSLGDSYRLRRARHLVGSAGNPEFIFVEADNPFFEMAPNLLKHSEDPVPPELASYFCSIPRMLFQVSGGRLSTDRSFVLNRIEVFHRNLREQTLFINALAWAR